MEVYVENFHLSYGHDRVFILVKCCCVLFITLFDHVHENFQNIWCQIPKSNVFESICITKQKCGCSVTGVCDWMVHKYAVCHASAHL